MDRKAFFIEACKQGKYKERKWVYSIFTIKRWKEEDSVPNPKDHFAVFAKDGYYCTHLPGQAEVFILENGNPIPITKTVLDVLEEFEVDVGDLPNVLTKVVTTPGNIFINWYCLVQHFGKKVRFQAGGLMPGSLGDLIVKRIHDDVPKEQRLEDDERLFVDEVNGFLSSLAQIASMASINAPSATPYTITTSPEVKELRNRLIEENKDRLKDPAVVADITKQIVDADKRWVAQDPHKGFLDIGKKAFPVSRKKLHGVVGLEYNMAGTKSEFVPTSLSEGINLKAWPMMIDTLRGGSYSRGAMTALGGVEVKFIFRAFNTSIISMEDCRTKFGIRLQSTERNLKNAMSHYIWVDGIEYLVTEENIPDIMKRSSYFVLRSPGYCQADKEGRGYCLKCMGESFRGSEQSLAAYGSEVASTMNGKFMGAMHGKAFVTVPWDLEETLS